MPIPKTNSARLSQAANRNSDAQKPELSPVGLNARFPDEDRSMARARVEALQAIAPQGEGWSWPQRGENHLVECRVGLKVDDLSFGFRRHRFKDIKNGAYSRLPWRCLQHCS